MNQTSLASKIREMDAEELEQALSEYQILLDSRKLTEEDANNLNLIRIQYRQITGQELVIERSIQLVS